MGYTMLKNEMVQRSYKKDSLEQAALSFIRDSCEGLRFIEDKAASADSRDMDFDGRSLRANQIPYNMEKDIDRLCFEKAIERFLRSGKKEDAFDVYFCYLEMFVGDYEKTRRMIEFLSEFEANGSALLMKHRDHYSHSVYVFILGLAVYESNELYRETYNQYYKIADKRKAACHYLRYWGLTSLFHDIGYPFELPFEQVASYFEVAGDRRENRPFVAYHALEAFVAIDAPVKSLINQLLEGSAISTTNELFAQVLCEKLGEAYGITRERMLQVLRERAAMPDKFNHFMDHAYFSATVLFRKMFEEMGDTLKREHLDALTAILMHNSLYKFDIAHYKSEGNKPFRAELHPLAYMLMLCDELQCWDRTAYGRNSKKELHPMGCAFDFSNNTIQAVYLFDKKEVSKINSFKDLYIDWLQNPQGEAPGLKAYSAMYIKKNGVSKFQRDIERIVDLTEIRLIVDTGLAANIHAADRSYLSDSNFIHLYNFALILNGRWNNEEWKSAKAAGQEDKFLTNPEIIEKFAAAFKDLSLEYKLSNINQAKAFSRYMGEIGCFYTDKPVDFELVDTFSEEELLKIGLLEHQRWLQEHYDMGWAYGTPDKESRDYVRQHKDMIPGYQAGPFEISWEAVKSNYERIGKAEQDKDTDPMECMLAMLRLFDGLRIYRL